MAGTYALEQPDRAPRVERPPEGCARPDLVLGLDWCAALEQQRDRLDVTAVCGNVQTRFAAMPFGHVDALLEKESHDVEPAVSTRPLEAGLHLIRRRSRCQAAVVIEKRLYNVETSHARCALAAGTLRGQHFDCASASHQCASLPRGHAHQSG